jgi:protein-tyrosine phosphatase
MAEMIFKDLIAKNDKKYLFHCESRALSTEEYGNTMYPKAIEELQKHNIHVERNVVGMVKKDDYYRYNYIVCMDMENYYDLLTIFQGDSDNKIKLLMSFTGRDEEIEDPWYTDDFETAYTQIEEGCKALFNFLMEEAKKKNLA